MKNASYVTFILSTPLPLFPLSLNETPLIFLVLKNISPQQRAHSNPHNNHSGHVVEKLVNKKLGKVPTGNRQKSFSSCCPVGGDSLIFDLSSTL
jgi:hypothetical protein